MLWGRGGKRKESLHLRPWNLNIYIRRVDAKSWLAEMTLVMIFRVFFNVCLHSRSFPASLWLAEVWQLSRRGVTGELVAEFKFQERCCKLFFLCARRRQSTPDSLLAGYNFLGYLDLLLARILLTFGCCCVRRVWRHKCHKFEQKLFAFIFTIVKNSTKSGNGLKIKKETCSYSY